MTFSLRKIVLIWGFILFLSGIATASPNTKICRNKNGKFPKPGTSCKGYYDCKNYVPEEMTCPDGEHFNANKRRCDWDELYPCLEKQKDKECLRENGLFLKPGTSCKKYYRCCNGKAKVENCPGDTLFDPSKGNCEWPDLYTCIESLSTTEKASSTITIFETSTLSDDQKEKTSTDPAISKSSTQKTTPRNRIISSTHNPGLERTNSRILETSTKFSTPTPTNDQSTSPTSETSTFSQIITNKISTTEIPTASESKEISTPLSTTEILTTLEPEEISTTLQPTPTKTSTLQPTTREISIIPHTTTPQMSSSSSTDHIISKENKEFEITEPTVFETTMEITFSPSTEEVTTSAELNIMCPEPNGHFPHPTDKHKFVACVHNKAYIFDCQNGLVYKHHLKRCDFP